MYWLIARYRDRNGGSQTLKFISVERSLVPKIADPCPTAVALGHFDNPWVALVSVASMDLVLVQSFGTVAVALLMKMHTNWL